MTRTHDIFIFSRKTVIYRDLCNNDIFRDVHFENLVACPYTAIDHDIQEGINYQALTATVTNKSISILIPSSVVTFAHSTSISSLAFGLKSSGIPP